MSGNHREDWMYLALFKHAPGVSETKLSHGIERQTMQPIVNHNRLALVCRELIDEQIAETVQTGSKVCARCMYLLGSSF